MGIFDIFKKNKSDNNLEMYSNYENNQVISFGNGCIASKKIFDENYS